MHNKLKYHSTIKKIFAIAFIFLIKYNANAQSVRVDGYGGKFLTISGPYNIDGRSGPAGGTEEFFAKQAVKYNADNIEVISYEASPYERGNSSSGKNFVQQIKKIVCYLPDIDESRTEIKTDLSFVSKDSWGDDVAALVNIYSKENTTFYRFSCSNKNKMDGSAQNEYSEYIETDDNKVTVGFKSVAKAEAFKKTLADKIFDYALNLDAPEIKRPSGAYNIFSDEYPSGKLAASNNASNNDESSNAASKTENPILTEVSTLELNGKTFYKYQKVVYNESLEKIFINRGGKEVGMYGGIMDVYDLANFDIVRGGKLLKNGKFIYYIDSHIYYDEAKKSMLLYIFGSTIKHNGKQVGKNKANFKNDTNGNNVFNAVDIAVLIDFYKIKFQ